MVWVDPSFGVGRVEIFQISVSWVGWVDTSQILIFAAYRKWLELNFLPYTSAKNIISLHTDTLIANINNY